VPDIIDRFKKLIKFAKMEDSNLFGAPSAASIVPPKFPDVTFPVPEINLFTPPFNAE